MHTLKVSLAIAIIKTTVNVSSFLKQSCIKSARKMKPLPTKVKFLENDRNNERLNFKKYFKCMHVKFSVYGNKTFKEPIYTDFCNFKNVFNNHTSLYNVNSNKER
jgi:hypothetical protein